MKKVRNTFRLLVTVLLLGGWLLAASALHVVWTGNKAIIIPKNRIGVRETYVNTSAWTADDLANHATLVKRLVATDHTDAFPFKVGEGGVDIEQALSKQPTTKPADPIADKVDQVVQKASDVVEHAKASVAR